MLDADIKYADIKYQVNRNAEVISENTEDIKKLQKFVFGNGEEGMDEILRMTCLNLQNLNTSFSEYKQDIKEEVKYQREKTDKYIMIAAGAFISSLLTLVGAILAWTMRISPLLNYLENQPTILTK